MVSQRVLAQSPKLQPGDRVAILSPAFAAPGFAPAVHEQAMRRLVAETGLVPVEFPTTRTLSSSPSARAADINAAFTDPSIRAIFATIGGDDQITVIPHLNAEAAIADPKPFFGYSDNTNLLNWLWSHGVRGYYGGSTQVQFGPGPRVDGVHLTALRAALFSGGTVDIVDPEESEDFGPDWLTPEALTEFGTRERTEPWSWSGPAGVAEGPSWGGCLEVIDQLALADRLPPLESLRGGILLIETSEELPSASTVKRWMRALGERGILNAVVGVLVARPSVSTHGEVPSAEKRAQLRAEQRDVVVSETAHYNERAVVCIGAPFGHTRPQWIVPYGGIIRLDGTRQTVSASFD